MSKTELRALKIIHTTHARDMAMILLYNYSVLRGATFKVRPFNSCALKPTMLPLFDTFLGLLLWNNFQYHGHIFWMSSVSRNLRPCKATLFFGNSPKSFGIK